MNTYQARLTTIKPASTDQPIILRIYNDGAVLEYPIQPEDWREICWDKTEGLPADHPIKFSFRDVNNLTEIALPLERWQRVLILKNYETDCTVTVKSLEGD